MKTSFIRTGRLSLAAVLALVIALGGFPAAAATTDLGEVRGLAPEESDGVTVLEASSTIEAALAWSRLTFPDGGASHVFLAPNRRPGPTFGSGGPQSRFQAPLLLTGRSHLPDAVVEELRRLGASSVTILGSSISRFVARDLRLRGLAVDRVQDGGGRIGTAVALARRYMFDARSGVLARSFPALDLTVAQTLASVPYSAEAQVPLVFSKRRKLPDVVREYLRESNIETLTLIGVFSARVRDELRRLGIATVSVEGRSAPELAVAVARELWPSRRLVRAGNAGDHPCVVLVDHFDVLSWAASFPGALYASQNDCPIVLSQGDYLPL